MRIVAIYFVGEMADEIFLIEGRKVGAQEIVSKSKQALVVNLDTDKNVDH